jgi:hypothetical protein
MIALVMEEPLYGLKDTVVTYLPAVLAQRFQHPEDSLLPISPCTVGYRDISIRNTTAGAIFSRPGI